jgi:hypothetical protein
LRLGIEDLQESCEVSKSVKSSPCQEYRDTARGKRALFPNQVWGDFWLPLRSWKPIQKTKAWSSNCPIVKRTIFCTSLMLDELPVITLCTLINISSLICKARENLRHNITHQTNPHRRHPSTHLINLLPNPPPNTPLPTLNLITRHTPNSSQENQHIKNSSEIKTPSPSRPLHKHTSQNKTRTIPHRTRSAEPRKRYIPRPPLSRTLHSGPLPRS